MTEPRDGKGPTEVNLAVPLIVASAGIAGCSIGLSLHNPALGVAVGLGVVILLGLLEWAGRRRRNRKKNSE